MAENPRDRLWSPNKFLGRFAALIAISCCLILIVSAFIGVIRGYSVQSTMFGFLVPTVIFCLCLCDQKKTFIQGLKDSFKLSLINLFYAVFLVYILIGCLQGGYYIKGCKFYNQRLYKKAATEFEKETQLWYLKLSSNTWEPSAMQKLAETYCQLEEFDKAIDVYELILSRYQGVDYDIASLSLRRLKDGLQLIARYKEENQGLQNDYGKLYDIAHEYESDLNCNRKALDIYETITQMNIAEKDKRDTCDAILRLTPVKNNNH